MKRSLWKLVMGTGIVWMMLTMTAVATMVRTVTTEQASGAVNGTLVEVPVARGSGVTLDFSGTGERIYKVWLDDPSRIVFDTDSPLGSFGSDCPESGATIVHLKQVNPIEFPGLPRTASTLMTIVTQTPARETRSYQFRVFPINTSSQVATIRVVPPPATRESVRSASQAIDQIPEASSLTPEQVAIALITQGMQAARQQNLLTPDQPLWAQLERCLQFLNRGYTLNAALRQSGVTMNAIVRLQQLAETPQQTRSNAPRPLDQNFALISH